MEVTTGSHWVTAISPGICPLKDTDLRSSWIRWKLSLPQYGSIKNMEWRASRGVAQW